ncbi:MAG: acyl-CoA thioesterase [Pseudomonadota bacterium]
MSAGRELLSTRIDVRWGDMDAYGHVNNAVYATYIEEARLRWFASLPAAWRTDSSAPVIAAQTVNYRRQLEGPAALRVALSVQRVGRSSLTIAFVIAADSDPATAYADGSSVLVWVDPASGRSIPLPAMVLAAAAGDATEAP